MNHCQSCQTQTSKPKEFFTAEAKSTWLSEVFIDSQNVVSNTTSSFTMDALPSVAEAVLKLCSSRASCVHQKAKTVLSGGKNGLRMKIKKFRNETRRNTCTLHASRIDFGSTCGFTLRHHLMGKLQASQHCLNS